jgi:dihydroneopterin aldolase
MCWIQGAKEQGQADALRYAVLVVSWGVQQGDENRARKLLVDVDAWSDLENAQSSDELDHSVSLYG